jgi:hypothetical protein
MNIRFGEFVYLAAFAVVMAIALHMLKGMV